MIAEMRGNGQNDLEAVHLRYKKVRPFTFNIQLLKIIC